MAEVYSSFGIKVERKPTSGSYTLIPRIEDVTPPNVTLQMEEFKTHDSPNGETEFRPSYVVTGTSTVKMKYDPADAQHTAIEADCKGKVKSSWRITLPVTPAKGWSFEGYVSEWKPGALGTDGFVEVEFTLTPTGGYTFGAIS